VGFFPRHHLDGKQGGFIRLMGLIPFVDAPGFGPIFKRRRSFQAKSHECVEVCPIHEEDLGRLKSGTDGHPVQGGDFLGKIRTRDMLHGPGHLLDAQSPP